MERLKQFNEGEVVIFLGWDVAPMPTSSYMHDNFLKAGQIYKIECRYPHPYCESYILQGKRRWYPATHFIRASSLARVLYGV